MTDADAIRKGEQPRQERGGCGLVVGAR
jgi:hypothetical protein